MGSTSPFLASFLPIEKLHTLFTERERERAASLPFTSLVPRPGGEWGSREVGTEVGKGLGCPPPPRKERSAQAKCCVCQTKSYSAKSAAGSVRCRGAGRAGPGGSRAPAQVALPAGKRLRRRPREEGGSRTCCAPGRLLLPPRHAERRRRRRPGRVALAPQIR